ncbi:MAG: 3-oxoadipyl-CoA thiolase [Rhodospirillaceae bacterium]|nr:3-oxoadipyl-CoA thiolase [Rhodospirillaceae bacterium]
MSEAYICDAIRTPVGRYGGGLSSIRTDDLAAIPIRGLMERNSKVEWGKLDDIVYGCANQAGEDNRNVARMAGLLAGLSPEVPGATINRLCGSSMDAVGTAARAIRCGEVDLVIAGGVESMSRAPFVIGKNDAPFSRNAEMYDTTIGWRFVNRLMKQQYGTDSMPETAENVAEAFQIRREDQDAFAYRSQVRAGKAQNAGKYTEEIMPVSVPRRKKDDLIIDKDEHLRPDTLMEGLAKLSTPFRQEGTVTAGNAAGVNDGACALLLASEESVKCYGLTPMVRVVAMATAGVEPRVMGMGPAPATRKVMAKAGLEIGDFDLIELNEAFAAQTLAVLRDLGLPDDSSHVNQQGGAIALGHPLGMSGARLITTAAYQLRAQGGKRALCTMCIGVGQGISVVLERV